MYLYLLTIFAIKVVRATNTTGDPTNLANWPPCAQKCIPIGLAPPAACGSLSNLSCLCQDPTFSVSIAACEVESCSIEETDQISNLSISLCAPVGGQPESVTNAIQSFLATAHITASGVPSSLPTEITAASEVLAVATLAPNLGNPTNVQSFPLCAQICNSEIVAKGVDCDLDDLDCACGAEFRSQSAACESITCNLFSQQQILLLAQELCNPIYNSDHALGSSVSVAISSATAAAAAAVSNKDPTNVDSYPACAQACISKSLPISGCDSLSNRKCVCQTSNFDTNTGPCENATCSVSDIEVITDLSNELCNPVGGIGNISNGTFVVPASAKSTGGIATMTSSPSPSTFTGTAPAMWNGNLGYIGWVPAILSACSWFVLLM